MYNLQEKEIKHKERIVEYYDCLLPWYQLLWHGNTYGMHYGFWEKGVRTHKEAIIATNKFIASKVNISKDMRILDVGCGIGGSALFLAKQYNVHVTGITLGLSQIKKAKRLSRKYKIISKTHFLQMDYLQTSFPSSSFDVVWGIESICHTIKKLEFLQEAYRLLKNGGELIVGDGFLLRLPMSREEQIILEQFCNGLVLPSQITADEFERHMVRVGFQNIRSWDKTEEIRKTAAYMYRLCRVFYPLSRIAERLRLVPKILCDNNRAGIAQYHGVQKGLFGYAVLRGTKP